MLADKQLRFPGQKVQCCTPVGAGSFRHQTWELLGGCTRDFCDLQHPDLCLCVVQALKEGEKRGSWAGIV